MFTGVEGFSTGSLFVTMFSPSPGVEGVSTVAVKTLKEAAGEKERRDLLQEMEMMKLLDPHPNVVTMLGCCTEKGECEASRTCATFIQSLTD